jgi:DNA-binding NarL/FixJ family response regulator
VMVGRACRALGDEDTALMEFGAARQVLALVASGRRNREIASDLVISEHTVARHIQNIFAKLGVRSRTEVSSFARSRDLL